MPLMRWIPAALLMLMLQACTERQARELAGGAAKPESQNPSIGSFGATEDKAGLSLRTGEQLLFTMARVTGVPITETIRGNFEIMIAQLPSTPDPTGYLVSRVAARQKLASLFCEPLAHYQYGDYLSSTWDLARKRLFGTELTKALGTLDQRVLLTRNQRVALGTQVLNQVLGVMDPTDSAAQTERTRDVLAFADFLDELLGVFPNLNAGVDVRHAAYGVCMAALTHPRFLVH